jgi:RNA polymerase sigma-70 factor (ECF subfamily)
MKQDVSAQKDEEIARSIQAGEIELFGILIERYEGKIKRYSRKFLSDREDINDVVQNIFIKAYTNIQSFDPKRKFSPWLYRIAHNELVNALKKKKPLSLFGLDTFFPHRFSDSALKEEIDRKDVKTMIDACLNKLEPKYKEPLILFYLEELRYEEIADVMQIPVSTVGVRLKRGKELMEKVFKKSNYSL